MTRRVYFIKPIGMDGPIKIGCSASPLHRRDTLATWSPFPLEIVAEIEGDLSTERRFHAKFFDSHQRSEWFSVTPELLATIEEIKEGSFDAATLPAPRSLSKGRPKGTGRKWTEKQKADAKRRRALHKIERDLGLCLPWPREVDLEERFLAEPHRYGITVEERRARWQKEQAERDLARAQQTLADIAVRMASVA